MVGMTGWGITLITLEIDEIVSQVFPVPLDSSITSIDFQPHVPHCRRQMMATITPALQHITRSVTKIVGEKTTTVGSHP